MSMLKTEQIRRCQGLENVGKHVMGMVISHNVFSLIGFQKMIVLFQIVKSY